MGMSESMAVLIDWVVMTLLIISILLLYLAQSETAEHLKDIEQRHAKLTEDVIALYEIHGAFLQYLNNKSLTGVENP